MKRLIITLLIALSISTSAQSASRSELMAAAKQAQSASEGGSASDDTVKANWQSSNYGPVQNQQTTRDDADIHPFGYSLFQGGFRGLRSDGLNPNYRILPGDQVTIKTWGAFEMERTLPVDAQGNIFLPSIGPVNVKGIPNSRLNTVVSAAIRKTYSDKVRVYTNLQGVQPISVFVAGFVENPGRYSGVPSDSALMFLDQAGGIDDQLGSYREISLLRDGKVISQLDLYQYMLEGELKHPQLQQGDTLLVTKRKPTVVVKGDIGRTFRFELKNSKTQGEEILALTQLDPAVTHVLQRGTRNKEWIAHYLSLQDFTTADIADGDELVFVGDSKDQQIVVKLEGAFTGQSNFVLPKNTTLAELLTSVAVDPQETNYQQISLSRVSVAERQKKALDESLRRLEATYLGASSSTAEESAIRVREAELISQFVQKASQIEPDGTMVVTNQGELTDIRLQDGDVIRLPERSSTVLITGEVFVPQSIVFTPGKTALDYIDASGGFSQHANEDNILIVRQNGEVVSAKDFAVQAGDQILVLPKAATKNLQLASTLTQILYQIAVSAKVIMDL